ncbi:Hypothetical protein PHPALM_10241 [Phytophthora palmivora]|uniref:M96 mating-specific protein family n=1 Tax=Phytophthora palmivora TaxID=4796 RepID=A0A2P4Y577_9STRA|nr:Hypothetical protein PHPALM_10241 [Phytophthora palmivora]
MSFLETNADDIVTVAEAIAYIDSFDTSSDATNPTICNDLMSTVSDNSSKTQNSQKHSHKEKSRRKKKSNPPGYTTQVLRRKRAELQSLREEARGLEEQLNELRNLRTNISDNQVQLVADDALTLQSKWHKLLEIERSRRRHSEETNRRLRTLLAHYHDAHKNLRQILQKKSLLKGLDFVFGNEPTPDHSFAAFENSKAIAGHLEQVVSNLYLESGSVFDSWSSSAISYSMRTKFDKKRGKVAEMKATTPVTCPMEVAADLMWQEQSGHRPDPRKWARFMRGHLPNSQEKHWVLALQCRSYVKKITGIQLLRKFEEPNRIVLVKTDLMTLTTEGLQFRDLSWTIITRSETDPKHASVVRIYEEIFLDCQQDFTARSEDIAYAQNVVLKNLSWKLHDCTQKLQDALMERFELHSKA